MHWHTVDYRKDEHSNRRPLLNRGFWLRIPRPTVICRVFGHKPVVDGTDGFEQQPGHRWVCCDRCGIRPEPQGSLDPTQWDIGDRYTGSFTANAPRPLSAANIRRLAERQIPFTAPPLPGPWPKENTGVFGGQLIIGKSFPGWSTEVKVGNPGSEQALAAHIRLYPFFALYLHTEDFGTWVQRRLNRTRYQSRVTGLDFSRGGIHWRLWAKRDESSRDDPWWMRGTIKLDPRDRLFGRSRYDYEDVGDPVTATVRMPHGDDHEVTLKLQRRTDGRNRRHFDSWTVDWTCRAGIATKPHGGHVSGAAVDVRQEAVDAETWPIEACDAIATRLTHWRTQYGYRTPLAAERTP